jgi:hypothetical protein
VLPAPSSVTVSSNEPGVTIRIDSVATATIN